MSVTELSLGVAMTMKDLSSLSSFNPGKTSPLWSNPVTCSHEIYSIPLDFPLPFSQGPSGERKHIEVEDISMVFDGHLTLPTLI